MHRTGAGRTQHHTLALLVKMSGLPGAVRTSDPEVITFVENAAASVYPDNPDLEMGEMKWPLGGPNLTPSQGKLHSMIQ